MKKVLTGVLVLVVIIAGGLFFFASRLDGIVAGIIEEQGSAATQTPVRVGGVSIDLADASGAIARLTVGNPDRFGGNAIEMEDFSIALDPSTLTDDTIVIRSVNVAGATLNVIQEGSGNNLREILDNLRMLQSGDAAADETGGRKVVIERFTLDGASASVDLPDFNETRRVELPTIVVRDIGRATNGATATQVAQQVLRPVVERALESAVAQSVQDRIREGINEATGGLLQQLDEAIGGADDDETEQR
ncbi:MAG: hypothetical protein R3315_12970 [Woeseiaceae bacterium]|nr:hypothetical protein [Woeseiaceae bacterium]